MESKDSDPWKKGAHVVLKKIGLFMRKGVIIELDAGNILVPLESCKKTKIVIAENGNVYSWTFLLADGSLADFFFHSGSYFHSSKKKKDILDDLRKFFCAVPSKE